MNPDGITSNVRAKVFEVTNDIGTWLAGVVYLLGHTKKYMWYEKDAAERFERDKEAVLAIGQVLDRSDNALAYWYNQLQKLGDLGESLDAFDITLDVARIRRITELLFGDESGNDGTTSQETA